MDNMISRVTIMAIGVSHYDDRHFNELAGPKEDLKRLKWLFVENKKTALFNTNQFIEVLNPDSAKLRTKFNEYILSRSSEGDILLFYFSGHGVAIGRNDFGFCTTDTKVHDNNGVTLPLSIVKFSELLSSIYIANIIPIIIIDACYSGIAGKQLMIPPIEAISNLENQIQTFAASSYALLCSCSENQTTIDTRSGGIFSMKLIEIGSQGLPPNIVNKPLLSINDIFPILRELVLGYSGDIVPRLYIGASLPEFPIIKNVQFSMRRYSLSPTYVKILEALWNNGTEKVLSPDEIGKLCKSGAYCNHNKLSFEPWKLVETIPNTKLRRLTDRGRLFMRGQLEVPKTVVQDPRNNIVVPAENTKYVKYQ